MARLDPSRAPPIASSNSDTDRKQGRMAHNAARGSQTERCTRDARCVHDRNVRSGSRGAERRLERPPDRSRHSSAAHSLV